MIDWVHECCLDWAREMRRSAYGSRRWPSRLVLAYLKGLGFTSAHRWECAARNHQQLGAQAERIMLAIQRLDRVHRDVLFAHYCLDGYAAEKARVLGISRRTYYARLDRASLALAGRLNVGRSVSPCTVDGALAPGCEPGDFLPEVPA